MGRVDDVLGGLLKKLGLGEELARQGVAQRWPEVVGERIASVTRVRAQAKGVLFVAVRSSAWLNELNLMRRELLSRLNAGAGDGRIERIVFQLAEEGELDPSGDHGTGGLQDVPGDASRAAPGDAPDGPPEGASDG